MANNCANTILFLGDRVEECMEYIKSRMTEDGTGIYLIDGEHEKYCFDLTIEDNVIDFITKWSPDIEQVHQLALKFNLDYRYNYEETSSFVYGCVISDGGNLSVIDLEEKHFDEIECDDETGMYTWRSEEYESEADILDMLLEEEILKN